MLSGQNGILNRAIEAKENIKVKSENELRGLSILEAMTSIENRKYVDRDGNKVIIPAGFAVSQVEGENTITDGLVIIDKNGNEFVWVEENDEFYADTETISEDEEAFVNSVNLNNGFFVSRYEIGNEGGTLISTQYDGTDMWTGYEGGIAVSKKNQFVWNYITRKKAMEISNDFYNSDSVSSRLISNNAFDTILKFINKLDANTEDCYNWGNYKLVSISQNEFGINAQYSIDGGLSYQSIKSSKPSGVAWLLTTGALEKRNEIKNIDGISGNVSTWTTSNKDISAIARGSYYDSSKEVLPASFLGNYAIDRAYYNMGFRIILYLH